MDKKALERMQEIMEIAYLLKWIQPATSGYPLMQLSEVEKCMDAMVNDFELERMRDWQKQVEEGRLVEVNGKLEPSNWREIAKITRGDG